MVTEGAYSFCKGVTSGITFDDAVQWCANNGSYLVEANKDEALSDAIDTFANGTVQAVPGWAYGAMIPQLTKSVIATSQNGSGYTLAKLLLTGLTVFAPTTQALFSGAVWANDALTGTATGFHIIATRCIGGEVPCAI